MTRRSYGVFTVALFTFLLLYFLYSIAPILLLFFIGVLFSLWLGALTDIFQRRLGFPRRLGLTFAIILTFVGVGGIGYLIVPPVIDQTRELMQTLPGLMQRWDAQLAGAAQRSRLLSGVLGQLQPGHSYFEPLLAQIRHYFTGAIPMVFTGFNFVIEIFGIFVMGVYLTLRPSLYREGFILLIPPVHRDLVRDILAELARTLRAWIIAQLMAMFILGVFTWVGLWLLGVPYALAFGVFTGAVAIVPFFGSLVSTMLPALFVIGSHGLLHSLFVVLLGVVVHIFEANIVAPMIFERHIHLPPVLTLLSVLVMGKLLGVIGLLVAVPILAVTIVVVRRVYVLRILEGKGFRRAIRDQAIELRIRGPEGDVIIHPAAREESIPALLER